MVVLADLDADGSDSTPDALDEQMAAPTVDRPRASAFVSHLAEPEERPAANPYAALAPESGADDVAPSAHNPYAELAPNSSDDGFVLPADVEPGDWESMLDEPPEKPAKTKKRRPSAFSRYT